MRVAFPDRVKRALLFIRILSLITYTVPLWGAETLPSIAEVQQQALRYAGMEAREIGRWRKQIRRAPLLPRLQVGLEKKLQRDLNVQKQDSVSVTSGGVVVGPTAQNNFLEDASDINFEVKAVWYLDQLLFNRDEIDISQEARFLASERQRLLQDVGEQYFAFQRLQEEEGRVRSREEKVKIGAEKDQSRAFLDAATGGWFSGQFPRKTAGDIPPRPKGKK